MQRETRTITTPTSKVSIVVNEYITGLEARSITHVYLREDLNPIDKYNLSQDLAFQLAVVSVGGIKHGDTQADGTKFDVAKAILALPSVDEKYVRDVVNEITNGKKVQSGANS